MGLGLEKQRRRVHIQGMVRNTLKVIAGAGLVIITGGAWPTGRYGWAIAIGAFIVLAAVLHFVAP
jgi:type IV secretory pathway VirB2 component (pilin)